MVADPIRVGARRGGSQGTHPRQHARRNTRVHDPIEDAETKSAHTHPLSRAGSDVTQSSLVVVDGVSCLIRSRIHCLTPVG